MNFSVTENKLSINLIIYIVYTNTYVYVTLLIVFLSCVGATALVVLAAAQLWMWYMTAGIVGVCVCVYVS